MKYKQLQDSITKSFERKNNLNFNCSNEYANELAREGIVVIDNFLSSKECTRYYNKISKFIDLHKEADPSGKVYIDDTTLINRGKYFNTDFNMIDIFDIDSALPTLKKVRKKVSFIKDIIAESGNVNFDLVNYNVYYNKSVKPRCLHVDNYTIPEYKAFIYLTDVNSLDDGPYMYVKGSHLCTEKKILSYVDNYKKKRTPTDMRIYEYSDALPCIAKKGTLVISDQSGVHGAHPQKDGHERMLLMMLYMKNKFDIRKIR